MFTYTVTILANGELVPDVVPFLADVLGADGWHVTAGRGGYMGEYESAPSWRIDIAIRTCVDIVDVRRWAVKLVREWRQYYLPNEESVLVLVTPCSGDLA